MCDNQKAVEQVKQLKSKGKTIGFVSGNFNIIHPGHLRFLLFAAEQADVLIVGVNDKAHSTGAYFSNEERINALQVLKFVDEVVLLKNDICEILALLQPDVVVKGKEFEHQNNIESEFLNDYSAKLVFSSGEKLFSTRDLLQKQVNKENGLHKEVQRYHRSYDLNVNKLSSALNTFSQLKVAVFGDVIVDEYQECLPIGMSQEDPTIAVSPLDSFKYLGGAGIVAAHAASMGASTDFYSVLGKDDNADFAVDKLEQSGINTFIEIDNSRPTTHKLRYRAKDKTLLRVNNHRKHDIDNGIVRKLYDLFISQINKYDLVIFSDFSYGVLCPDLIDYISQACNKHNIPFSADSQTSSQIGDLTKFQKMLLTTPTELEARLATKDENSGLIQVSTTLGQTLQAKNVIVTLGGEGALIRHYNAKTDGWETDNLPALANNTVDIAGAGDAFFVTSSLALVTGLSVWQAAFLGSVAASIQVNVRGNIPISKQQVLESCAEFLQ